MDLNSNVTIVSTMETIKEKARIECTKTYIGTELSKLINNPDKLPQSLIDSINDFIIEIDKLRIFTIRELKTLSKDLITVTSNFSENLYEFIYLHTLFIKNSQEGNNKYIN